MRVALFGLGLAFMASAASVNLENNGQPPAAKVTVAAVEPSTVEKSAAKGNIAAQFNPASTIGKAQLLIEVKDK